MDNKMNLDAQNSVVLDESLTISEATTLYETLKCMLATDQDVTVDASRVKSIDTASMQLIAAFAARFSQSGNELVWEDESESFRKTATLLDLQETLGCHI